jgi:hypothetical protein
VIGGLTQIAEIFAENRILDLDIRQVMKPRSGQVLEVIIRLQEPQHFNVSIVYFIRINDAGRADRFVAGAMSSCWSIHAPEHMLATMIWERLDGMRGDHGKPCSLARTLQFLLRPIMWARSSPYRA